MKSSKAMGIYRQNWNCSVFFFFEFRGHLGSPKCELALKRRALSEDTPSPKCHVFHYILQNWGSWNKQTIFFWVQFVEQFLKKSSCSKIQQLHWESSQNAYFQQGGSENSRSVWVKGYFFDVIFYAIWSWFSDLLRHDGASNVVRILSVFWYLRIWEGKMAL